MNNNLENNGGSKVGNAISWTLKTIIRLILAAFLLLALSAVIWFGWQQVDQWMDSMSRRVVILETDTEFLFENEAAILEQLSSLSTRVAVQEEGTSDLETQVSDQIDVVDSISLQVNDLVIASAAISESVDLFGEGLVSLQGDVNENIARIDTLGGQVDALSSSMSGVETQVTVLEEIVNEPNEDVVRLREALSWFRLWEMIARARLRLAENNPGLAAEEVERTLAAVLVANSGLLEDGQGKVEALVSRLELAGENLPDDPLAAARDLESAWEVVDEILLEIIGLEISR